MQRSWVFPALAAALIWSPMARAQPTGAAVQLYAAGDFVAAADAADTWRSADNLTFAARALLAACATASAPSSIDSLLSRAEVRARGALALDPNSIDARLQLALVYGMQSRRAPIATAFAAAYAPRGRRLIEQALALDPDDAHAHAMLGAWHLEVLRRGGLAGAVTYGARLSEGLAEFERARVLAPEDPLIALHYAVALIDLNPVTYAPRAQSLLHVVSTIHPRDALESMAQHDAARLADALSESPANGRRVARESLL
jgi:hypothetical protein